MTSRACLAQPLEWVVFPGEDWERLAPEEAGLADVAAWSKWVAETSSAAKGAAFQGEDHSGDQWGVAVARGGFLLQTFGDPDYAYQTASLGKCFVMACLQLAIDAGLISSGDDEIWRHWTGEGELNGAHKYLTQGHHLSLSFNHLKTHTGGFPVTNGWSWQRAKNYEVDAPAWSTCTNDPDYDNIAHAAPGTVGMHYSSGGFWRLAQSLTAVWKTDLKQVMDEKLFSRMGIPAERWDWTPGQVVHDTRDFYPAMPGYGLFLDPPYQIGGNVVRGGGAWVVMSAKDLARFGLLVATGGWWRGERLISSVQGHGGGNGSDVGGVGGRTMGAWGKVTSTFNQGDLPWRLFTDPPRSGRPRNAADPSAARESAKEESE